MDGAGIERAHVVGLSMGGFATLHFGLDYPERALSLVAAGVGYGAEKSAKPSSGGRGGGGARLRDQGQQGVRRRSTAAAPRACSSRPRIRGAGASSSTSWPSIRRSAPPTPCAACRRGGRRSTTSRTGSSGSRVPTLIVAGDEDDNSLQPSIFLKRTIPACGLLVLPKTGHTINLEEPDGVQPCGRRLSRPGRRRSLAAARPARPPDEILKTS